MSNESLKPEKSESIEAIEVSKEQAEKLQESINKEASSAEKNDHHEVYKARKSVESQAISGKEVRSKNNEKNNESRNVTKAEKTRIYKSTMGRVQNQLPAVSRTFSKFIHTPVIEKTSSALSTTVARPSGILGAGVIGFILFTSILYFAKRNGFAIPNNSSLFILVLIGGWVVGLLIEVIYKTFRKLSGR